MIGEHLKGRTVESVEESKWEEFILVKFADGSLWLITSLPWNCGGSKLEHRLSMNGRAEAAILKKEKEECPSSTAEISSSTPEESLPS